MKGLQGADLHYDWEEWNTVVISVPEQALKGLQKNPNIEKLEPDVQVEIFDSPIPVVSDVQEEGELLGDEPFTRSGNGSFRRRRLAQVTPYGVDMMEVRKLGVRGQGQKVCVIDSGYDRNHPDLPKDVIWVGSSSSPFDLDGHGTHVAGTIAALENDVGVVGVAPRAQLVILPLKGLAGGDSFVSETVDAIRMCRNKGAKIVNMSYGKGGVINCQGKNNFTPFENDRLNEFFYNDNMLLVAAAGNHGICDVNYDTLSYPASYDAVISVAAVDSGARRADFSAKNNYVNIAAPGVGIRSTVPPFVEDQVNGYVDWDGTSMASPHVAAMAAVVWSAMPWLSAPDLRARLLFPSSPTNEPYTGRGLITHGFVPVALQMSGKCLDHQGGTTDRGKVHLWECHGGPQSLWTYDPRNFLIVSSFGWCLNADPWQGGSVYISKCDPSSGNQRWYLTTENTFKFRGGTYCLDAHAPDTFKNGGTVQLWGCNGASNQKWHFQASASEKTRLCRDCTSGGDNYFATVGDWNSMPHQIGDNQLKRVDVPKGYAIQYFEHGNFGGWNGWAGSPDSWIRFTLPSGYVSSFKIRKIPDTGIVKLCSNTDCTGGVFYATVGMWANMPSEIGDNQLSFVYIPRGYTFEYFEHPIWSGWSRKFGSCDEHVNLNMNEHDNAVSSFKIGVAC
jgi:hypothetical protein